MDQSPIPNAAAARPDHNHERCIAQALLRAEGLCSDSGARLTSLRRAVLMQIWQGHAPVKAYDILDRLGDMPGTARPPTVYRALQFLRERGLVHRLESLNAFVGCARPEQRHEGQFLICTGCGVVREIGVPRITAAVTRAAREAGFTVERQTIEVSGRCARCR
jgi:Fur family zinc uptake transcriptional regulator